MVRASYTADARKGLRLSEICKPDDFSVFGHNRDLLVMNLH